MEVMNLEEEDVNPEELLNWNHNVCKDCPPDRSEGLCINAMGTINKNALDQLKWLKDYHDSPIAGYPAQAKTLELIKSNHHWQGMRRDVDRYVCNCNICQRSKPRNQKTHRWLEPLEVPQ
jgi:hypothetical protein